jgi:hypothetical protein
MILDNIVNTNLDKGFTAAAELVEKHIKERLQLLKSMYDLELSEEEIRLESEYIELLKVTQSKLLGIYHE